MLGALQELSDENIPSVTFYKMLPKKRLKEPPTRLKSSLISSRKRLSRLPKRIDSGHRHQPPSLNPFLVKSFGTFTSSTAAKASKVLSVTFLSPLSTEPT